MGDGRISSTESTGSSFCREIMLNRVMKLKPSASQCIAHAESANCCTCMIPVRPAPPPPPPQWSPPPLVWCGCGLLPSPPCGVVWLGCGLWWLPPFPPCGVVWVGWFPPACLDPLGVFRKPMLMMILMMMMTITMIIIITIILVFLWLVVGYLLPTCLLTIMALLTLGPRSL